MASWLPRTQVPGQSVRVSATTTPLLPGASALLDLAGLGRLGHFLAVSTDAPGWVSFYSSAAAREADGRAIGNSCRQTGRVLEECYALNPKYQKAAIFNGWRDMDGYMRENKIETSERPGDGKSADGKSGDAKSGDGKSPAGDKSKEAAAAKSAAAPAAAKH